jgi:hypothetical protein
MTFTYLKGKFWGEGINLWSEAGVHIEVNKEVLSFKDWAEVREFTYKFDDINKEAALTKKRQSYGKDLVVFPEEGQWTVWWKGKSITIGDILLRLLPVILRFFMKKYHKLMLDYNTFKLKEGFEVDIASKAYNSTLEYHGL